MNLSSEALASVISSYGSNTRTGRLARELFVARQAMVASKEILESLICHVSHGGPTRADGAAVLVKVKQALDGVN